MIADQVAILGVVAVFCSIVCGTAALLVPHRFAPRGARARQPVPQPPARHASRRPVDTPGDGVRGPLRSAGPQRAPDTLYIDQPIARPYVPDLVVKNRRQGDPRCGLCWDGQEVVGEACMLCGAAPIMRATA